MENIELNALLVKVDLASPPSPYTETVYKSINNSYDKGIENLENARKEFDNKFNEQRRKALEGVDNTEQKKVKEKTFEETKANAYANFDYQMSELIKNRNEYLKALE